MKKFTGIDILLILFIFALYNNILSQEICLVPQNITKPISIEISGELAKDYVYHITRFDRIQASEGWHTAALYIKKQLNKYGITNVEIEKFKSNGQVKYFTWTPPLGWRAKTGELWMVKPIKKRLASYEKIPTSLVKGSQTADVTGEVIHIIDGTKPEDYKGIDVKGKFILATGYTGNVHREGVIKRGALGVVTYLDRLSRFEYPDLIQYTALWPRLNEKEKTTFGFNISRMDAEIIIRYLSQGEKVILHAKVEGENYESNVEMMSAIIKGTKFPDKEIIIMGHLDHYKPGANDNASGSAGMLEVARTIKKLIDNNILPPPERTLRFLWVTEFNGTVPWLYAHPEVSKKVIAAYNFDMIGEDLFKTNSYFYFTRTPHSLPSFLNDLTENITSYTASLGLTSIRGSRYPFHYRVIEYSGGSDHVLFCDGSIGVPALMLGHPDPYHHTIQDTPDKVDESELKRVCFIGATGMYYMANAGSKEAIDIANLCAARASGRIASDVKKCMLRMKNNIKSEKSLYIAYKEAMNCLKYSFIRENKTILSSLVFSRDDKTNKYIETLAASLQNEKNIWKKRIKNYYSFLAKKSGFNTREITLNEEEKSAQKIVPVRTSVFKTSLSSDYLIEKLGTDVRKMIKINRNVQYEVANFINGKYNILDIRNAVSAEYGPQPLKDILSYIEILKKAGLVQYK